MNKVRILTIVSISIIVVCLLLLFQTSFVGVAEDITGEWEIKTEIEFDENISLESFAALSIFKKAYGSLAGKWGSKELTDFRFKNGKLTFARIHKTRVRDFRYEYNLTLKEGKLTGTMSTASGNNRVNGTRKKLKSPALGQWEINYNNGEREITGRLTISEEPDGKLVSKWDAERGEHVISNVKFQGEKLTFTRNSKYENFEIETTFEGIIKEHKLNGVFRSRRGEFSATGERVGAALVGKWELTKRYFGGTISKILKINGDLTGRYIESEGDEISIKKLKLEGDQVTFLIDMGWGKKSPSKLDFYILEFKGRLDGKTIRGKLRIEGITKTVTYKKID